MKYKLILFDYDFTLIDCSVSIIECFNRSFTDMGLTIPDENGVRFTIGMTLPKAFEYLTGDSNPDRNTEFFERFKIHADMIMTDMTEFIGGAENTIKRLHSEGYMLGIITTKLGYRIDDFLNKRNLRNMFSIVIGIDGVDNPKPAPDGILRASAELRIEKSKILYVGDNEIDGQAAKNAGVDFFGVLSGTTPREVLCDYTDKIADTVNDIALYL